MFCLQLLEGELKWFQLNAKKKKHEQCVVAEIILISPMEGFFALNPPYPQEFPIKLHAFAYKFWQLRPPSPRNFQ